ncbi:hypothetical protein SSPIM334S_01267 [Streptomyces spiroverticillatus]
MRPVSPSPAVVSGLCALAVAASLVEFVVRRGSIPRMFAESAQTGGTWVQLAVFIGLLCLCAGLPLALLGSRLAGVAVTAASLGSVAALGTVTVAGLAAQLVAHHRLGRHGHPVAVVLLAAPFLVLALERPGDVRTLLLAVLAPMAACTGLALRSNERDRAHRATHDVMRDVRWENAAREERARIVRELHDVVGHHISMISVQAETARVATPGMPDQGRERLLGIGDTARAALTEMRRLLGVLREERHDDTAAPDTARRPQPDLARLHDLLDEARAASAVSVRLVLAGDPRPLAPGVELAAYRIVQESLTNARKHAPGSPVDVELHYAPEALHVRIRDNGPGPPDTLPDDRHGLLGMRERAGAVGGELRSGPGNHGGFTVEARFPADPAASGTSPPWSADRPGAGSVSSRTSWSGPLPG